MFFYLLDSLLAERKDRSILFWKSLPISDAEVVSSKVITALVLAPIVCPGGQRIHATRRLRVVWCAARHAEGLPGELLMPWDASVWMQVQVAFLVLVPAVILWYLPIAAYLLLVSVWARKNAFLWAVLPPAGILLVEGLLTAHALCRGVPRRGASSVRSRSWTFTVRVESDGDDPGRLRRRTSAACSRHYETWLGVLVARGIHRRRSSAFVDIATIPDTASRPGGFTHSAIFRLMAAANSAGAAAMRPA